MSFIFSKNLTNAQVVLHTLKKDTEHIINHIKEIENHHTTPKTINDLMNLKAIENSLSQIKIGIDDTELMITFSKFIELLEAENLKLQLSLRRQSDETCWLRQELSKYQKIAEKYQAENVFLREKLANVEFQRTIKGITDEISSIPIDHGCINHGVESVEKDQFIANVKKKVINPSMAQSVFSFSSKNNVPLENSKFVPNLTSPINSSDQASPSANSMLGSMSSNASSMIPSKFRKLQSLVNQYSTEGKFDIASSLCLQTIKDIEKGAENFDNPNTQSEIASILNILAIVYKDQNKFDDAAKVLQQVLDIREKTLDPYHPMVAASLNNLSILYAKAGKYAEAEPLCLRALSIREKILGKDHIDVAKQLNNLALLYQGQNKNQEIERCFERSLEIFSLSNVSSDSIQVLKAKNSLANAKLKLNKIDDSEMLVKEILTPNPKITKCLPIWKSIESKIVEDAAIPLMTFQQWTSTTRIDVNSAKIAAKTLVAIYQKKNLNREAVILSDWLQSITTKSDQSSTNILADRNTSPRNIFSVENGIKSQVKPVQANITDQFSSKDTLF